MTRRNSFAYIVALIFLVAMAQYASVAIDSVVHANVQLWTLDSTSLDDAGPFKYLKDFFVFGFGLYWPVAIGSHSLPNGARRMILLYFIWIMAVVALGLVAFVVQWSPLFFLPSGLRWIALLHCSFGLFLFSRDLPQSPTIQRRLLYMLSLFATLDVFIVTKQFSIGSAVADIAFAQGRITGVFSNAGIAGMFGIALAIFGMMLDRGGWWPRLLLIALSLFIAISSGTRFAVLSIAILGVVTIWETTIRKTSRNHRLVLTVVASPLALGAAIVGYTALIDAVGRGDMIGTQLEQGGRITNLFSILSMLGNADLAELLFGRGLGIGTNTAVGYLVSRGVDPNLYRFNTLIDDAFITICLQIGVLGLMLFMVGMIAFLRVVKPHRRGNMKFRYIALMIIALITCFAGSVFEQYFLLTSLFIAFGDTYWKSAECGRKTLMPPRSERYDAYHTF